MTNILITKALYKFYFESMEPTLLSGGCVHAGTYCTVTNYRCIAPASDQQFHLARYYSLRLAICRLWVRIQCRFQPFPLCVYIQRSAHAYVDNYCGKNKGKRNTSSGSCSLLRSASEIPGAQFLCHSDLHFASVNIAAWVNRPSVFPLSQASYLVLQVQFFYGTHSWG